jgi:hypothetical protein
MVFLNPMTLSKPKVSLISRWNPVSPDLCSGRHKRLSSRIASASGISRKEGGHRYLKECSLRARTEGKEMILLADQ